MLGHLKPAGSRKALRFPMAETRLYEPVKEYWTARGYTVRAEVEGCDLVARRGDELVVVELKESVNLTLILQGIDRKSLTEEVYLAVPAPKNPRRSHWRQVVRLCRMLGLGLMTVYAGRGRRPRVEVACEPGPYVPRPNLRRRARLIREFADRSGDFNVGGSSRRPLVTAYREDALCVARFLEVHGPSRVRDVSNGGAAERAGAILQRNYYGWFVRVSRGVYDLTPAGREALERYRDVVESLESKDETISSSSPSTPASTNSHVSSKSPV